MPTNKHHTDTLREREREREREGKRKEEEEGSPMSVSFTHVPYLAHSLSLSKLNQVTFLARTIASSFESPCFKSKSFSFVISTTLSALHSTILGDLILFGTLANCTSLGGARGRLLLRESLRDWGPPLLHESLRDWRPPLLWVWLLLWVLWLCLISPRASKTSCLGCLGLVSRSRVLRFLPAFFSGVSALATLALALAFGWVSFFLGRPGRLFGSATGSFVAFLGGVLVLLAVSSSASFFFFALLARWFLVTW